MKKKGRGIYIVFAVVGIIGLLAVGRVFAGGGGGGQVAIDTTGGTQGSPEPSLVPTQPSQSTQAPKASQIPKASQTPKASPTPKAISKPVTIEIDPTQLALPHGPAIVLNPGLVREGSKVSASGFGFDASATLDLLVKKQASDQGNAVAIVRTDENGAFGDANFSLPDGVNSGSFMVLAKERNSSKTAQAQGRVASGAGAVKVTPTVGKPGDNVTVSLHGFGPGEDIKVYFNAMAGDPAAVLHADGGGSIGQGSLRVPVGVVGTNVFLFTGSKSQTLATAQFYLLALYPTLDLGSYAAKPATTLTFSGKGYAPKEAVSIYLNTPSTPILTAQAGGDGSFTSPGFLLPYKLKGNQTLIGIGDLSRASASAGFQVLPYSPDVQPSTYGGRPGTGLSFYATAFGPNEVVLVYANRTPTNPGKLVSAFRVNGKGNAAAAGNYVIPADAQGKLVLTLVGRDSDGVATATVSVEHSDTPVNIPPQPDYVLPPELQDNPAPATSPSPAPSASARPAPLLSASPVPSASAAQTPAKVSPSASPAATSSASSDLPEYVPAPAAARVPAHGGSWWSTVTTVLKSVWNALSTRL